VGLNIFTTMKFKNLHPIHETHYKYIVKERGIKNIHGQIPANIMILNPIYGH